VNKITSSDFGNLLKELTHEFYLVKKKFIKKNIHGEDDLIKFIAVMPASIFSFLQKEMITIRDSLRFDEELYNGFLIALEDCISKLKTSLIGNNCNEEKH